jgi:multidrug resistance efflux pump
MNQENTQQAETPKESIFKKPWLQSIIVVVVIFGALGGFLFWQGSANTVSIENSVLEAPLVSISSSAPGILQTLYVHEGDKIAANTQVALVGSDILTSKQSGIVAQASENIGSYFTPGQSVVTVVDTANMKVVGSIEETKGLKDLAPGQRATFTVDAFPGKKYSGIVDAVGASSQETGVTFSISDKRPVNKFEVKVRFSVDAYPELKNGMSAKITVYTK